MDLVAAANAGDSSAFEGLYLRYRDWVVNLACRIVGDRDMALDILQETFIYFARKFPGFTLTCQVKSFLYPVVKHLALNARQKSLRYESGEDLFEFLEADPVEPAEEAGLQTVLASLPTGQREVLVLRFIEDMTLAEIAEVLEVPIGTVKSRLHNALDTLRGHPKTRHLLE